MWIFVRDWWDELSLDLEEAIALVEASRPRVTVCDQSPTIHPAGSEPNHPKVIVMTDSHHGRLSPAEADQPITATEELPPDALPQYAPRLRPITISYRTAGIGAVGALAVIVGVVLAVTIPSSPPAPSQDAASNTTTSAPQTWDHNPSDQSSQKLANDFAIAGLPLLTPSRYLNSSQEQNESWTYDYVAVGPCADFPTVTWNYVQLLDSQAGMPVDLSTFESMVGIGIMVQCPSKLYEVPPSFQPQNNYPSIH